MQTIEVSDVVYQRILSQREGSESISSVLLRILPEENWDVEKISADMDEALQSTTKLHTLDEVFGDL
ncbi:MAG TPA: hypothetical protein O0X25_04140 [Methanocorpusculum sp.]|nr:hypothetical protein [Methanocorpusculum sp.]HJJ49789.1 hypothetical protein [Methanocorpusculum sp.]HJJ57373.1 hypothetical protein [Methanocorpusculum sp.]